jgi:uncharacterized protein YbjT (DUF2867 family)
MVILILGASGSAGGGVLQACLESPAVTEIRAIARRPLAAAHPRLRVVQHQDYADYSAIASAFAGVDACLYCLGKSSTQVSGEAEYRRLTYDFALAAARAFWAANPTGVFQFISGKSTRLDSRYMWARVKAETERDLLATGHPVNCWRPAAIDGPRSASEPMLFTLARPIVRVVFGPFRSLYVRAEDIGVAMLAATEAGTRGRTFENAEIRDLADAARAAGKGFGPPSR